jgi:hypothetical protein
MADFSEYPEEMQEDVAKTHAWLHLKFLLQKAGCWVPNPRDPRGSYDMDYCLGVANAKGFLSPEMQQMAAQLNADKNRVHHHPFADVSTGGPVAAARLFLRN